MGCSKSLESADASLDHGISDPAACGCSVSNYALTMSWDCFCRQYDCSATEPPQLCASSGGQWTKGCGLSEYSIGTIGGPYRSVYEANGGLVGREFGTDDGQFSCPTDPTMIGYRVRAGQFPDGCESAVTCQCNADGGGCDPTDAGLSLDLF